MINNNPYIQNLNSNPTSQNSQPTPNTQPKQSSQNGFLDGIFSGSNGSDFLKGALIGAAATYILTNENAQRAIFKGFARALAEAVAFDSRVHGVMSSKGTL